MKTYMFPGQGSQSKGMGEGLFERFAELTKKADNILGFSIKELCLEDPGKKINETQFTQPALYVVNALSYYKALQDTGVEPDFVAGHSLGEFNALLAAGGFDFETGLKLVKKRGELMSQAPEGAMAAILRGSKEQIESVLEKNGLHNIDLANYNTPSQIVISGAKKEIAQAQACFQEAGMAYYPLNTSGAFHSRFMEPIKEQFSEYLKQFEFSELKIPVISNVTARPYNNEDVVKNMSAQLASGVRWSDSIQYLINHAKSASDEMEFVEIGSGDVLTKIYLSILRELPKVDSAQDDAKETLVKTNAYAVNSKVINAASTGYSNTPIDQLTFAQQKVDEWNRNNPVGVKVKSNFDQFGELETKSHAVVLFGHRAAIYMKGYRGYFDLDEITLV
ncbi:ACP S-malonyltransferase [Paraneptunicella aestuarii]|uniref:ACP S-malonyltransferase n=1 Tax=Paraneptunicella aestuarii TaxID=2831148 RepID=UPI001E62ACDA|nr:ACP S-malonyltransferase [Paraneptunicella aestuarii]UAA37179.1 ACP S-malonyltransferase [Paraneptunicella aestuarii]